MTDAQPITLDQLALLYRDRNAANSAMSQALRSKNKALITQAKTRAGELNRAYSDAQRRYKRQQKASQRAQWRTTMIRF